MSDDAPDLGGRGSWTGWAAAALGLVVVAVLVRAVGVDALVERLRLLGLRFPLVVLLETPRFLFADALVWWILLGYRKPRGVSYARLCAYSLAGYAITNGTPLADGGGEVLKAWLVAAEIGAGPAGAASIAFAGLFAAFSSLGMLVLGLGALAFPDAPPWVPWCSLGISAAMTAAGSVILGLLHVRDPASRVARAVGRLPVIGAFARRVQGLAEASDRELSLLLAARGRLLAAGAVLVAVRCFQAVDARILLGFLGATDVSLSEAALVQCFGLVATFFFSWVPAQLGSNEGATLLLLDALGRDPALPVAFEVTRHVRTILWVAAGFAVLFVLLRRRGRSKMPR